MTQVCTFTQAELDSIDEQLYGGQQFSVGDVLIPNIAHFEGDRTRYIQFLRDARRVVRIGYTYEFIVKAVHGRFDGKHDTFVPRISCYISIEGSEKRFPESYFLKKT